MGRGSKIWVIWPSWYGKILNLGFSIVKVKTKDFSETIDCSL